MPSQNLNDGFCHCGCGEKAPVATKTCRGTNRVKGQPMRYVSGHNTPRQWRVEVDPDTGCHNVAGIVLSRGYAVIYRNGKHRLAHRYFYEQARGIIPEGFDLDHLCRNRGCVNPDHLEPVTQAINTQRGSTAKLTLAAVREIRESSESGASLARRIGVSESAVSLVRRNRTWVES